MWTSEGPEEPGSGLYSLACEAARAGLQGERVLGRQRGASSCTFHSHPQRAVRAAWKVSLDFVGLKSSAPSPPVSSSYCFSSGGSCVCTSGPGSWSPSAEEPPRDRGKLQTGLPCPAPGASRAGGEGCRALGRQRGNTLRTRVGKKLGKAAPCSRHSRRQPDGHRREGGPPEHMTKDPG